MSNLSEILLGETAKKICSVPVCEIPIKCILDKSIFINILAVKNEPFDLTFLVAAGIQIFYRLYTNKFELPVKRCLPRVLSLIHIGSFPLLALWGNKNGLPSMKVKKLKKFKTKWA